MHTNKESQSLVLIGMLSLVRETRRNQSRFIEMKLPAFNWEAWEMNVWEYSFNESDYRQ